MRRGIACFVLTLGFLFSPLVRAQDARTEPAPLQLNDVLSSAERTFPLLKAAELERAIANGDVLSAEGGFDVSWKTRGTVTPVTPD